MDVDDVPLAAVASATITVLDINDPEFEKDSYSVSIDEDLSLSSPVCAP